MNNPLLGKEKKMMIMITMMIMMMMMTNDCRGRSRCRKRRLLIDEEDAYGARITISAETGFKKIS